MNIPKLVHLFAQGRHGFPARRSGWWEISLRLAWVIADQEVWRP
jgi:hypothetical protein